METIKNYMPHTGRYSKEGWLSEEGCVSDEENMSEDTIASSSFSYHHFPIRYVFDEKENEHKKNDMANIL